jgi:hypothetical protein
MAHQVKDEQGSERSFAGVFRRAASALMGSAGKQQPPQAAPANTSFEIRSSFQPTSAAQIRSSEIPIAFEPSRTNLERYRSGTDPRSTIYRRWESFSPPGDTQLQALSRSAAALVSFEEEKSVEIRMSSKKPQRAALQSGEVRWQNKTKSSAKSPPDATPGIVSSETMATEQETDHAWATNAIYGWLHRHLHLIKSAAFQRWEVTTATTNQETCQRKHNIRRVILEAEKERIDRMETIYAGGHETRVTFFSNPTPHCGLSLVANKFRHCSIG